MKHVALLLLTLTMLTSSCEKDQNRKLLGAYFKYSINGKETIITDEAGINNNIFDCTIKGDTVLNINVAKFYEGAGFVVRSKNINDGAYSLDSVNKAYYTNPLDQKRYSTTSKYKGNLFIKKGTFQAKELLYTLSGTFAYQAVDTATGKTFNIIDGSFLMEQKTIK